MGVRALLHIQSPMFSHVSIASTHATAQFLFPKSTSDALGDIFRRAKITIETYFPYLAFILA